MAKKYYFILINITELDIMKFININNNNDVFHDHSSLSEDICYWVLHEQIQFIVEGKTETYTPTKRGRDRVDPML